MATDREAIRRAIRTLRMHVENIPPVAIVGGDYFELLDRVAVLEKFDGTLRGLDLRATEIEDEAS